MCDQGMWMTSCTGSVRRGFWEIWEKLVSRVSWVLGPRKTVDFRGSPKAGQWPCGRCRRWFGADGKVSIERWYLSPYVEKPFNSKVIKSFVLELRSRKFFFCFSGFQWYLYTFYEHYVYFTHIKISGYDTIVIKISISFPNSFLVISQPVTFLLGYNAYQG